MQAFIRVAAALLFAVLLPQASTAESISAPAGASVYIISPADGEVVSSPVTVRFGLRGMGVAPAGVQHANTGHHHLLIDAPLPALDQPIPSDDHHRHFGGGQTQVTLDLQPGRHTLQLLMGDFAHRPHQPALYSPVIHIMVAGDVH